MERGGASAAQSAAAECLVEPRVPSVKRLRRGADDDSAEVVVVLDSGESGESGESGGSGDEEGDGEEVDEEMRRALKLSLEAA